MRRFRLHTVVVLGFVLTMITNVSAFDVESPRNILFHLSDEGVYPDHVLQEFESATLSFSITNLATDLTAVTWHLAVQDGSPVTLSPTTGSLPDIEATVERIQFLSVPVSAEALGPLPSRTRLTLTLDHADGEEIYSFYISLTNAEVLLISDGMEGVREVIAPVLERNGVVWGYAGVPMNQLTIEMFDAWTIMIEADARYSEYLFTDEDEAVRDWFRYGNGGSISGLYLDQTYPAADPRWLGGLGAVWNDPIDETVFYGVPDDEIADGRIIEACSSEGVSVCYPCCGNPANFNTTDGTAVAGWLDYGWRIVDYGFSLVHLVNEGASDMTRDELIERTVNWMLYRETSVDEPAETTLQPAGFELNAYPNPFNAFLTISLSGQNHGFSPVQIVNANGQLVETLYPSGSTSTQLNWDATHFPSGSYYVKTATPDGIAVRKVTLLK
jgi:Secretion system C-terminal sorting domain